MNVPGAYRSDQCKGSALLPVEIEGRLHAERTVALQERLQAIRMRLSAAVTIEEVGAAIVTEGSHALGLEHAALWIEQGDHLQLLHVVGGAPEWVERFARVPIGSNLPIAAAAAKGEPFFLASREEYAHLFPESETAHRRQGEPPLAFACLPLAERGKRLGAMAFVWSGEHAFVADERRFLEMLARDASLAVDRARLFAAERQARRRLGQMYDVIGALSAASTAQEVAGVACRVGTEASDARSAALWIVDGDASLRLAGSWGVPPAFLDQFRVIPMDGSDAPAARVVRSGQPIWIQTEEEYRRESPRIADEAARFGRLSAYGAVPLELSGKTAGVLVFSHPLPHPYDDDERTFYQTLARHCAQALDRARLLDVERRSNERLRVLAAFGEALSSSLDLDGSLAEAARKVVPAFADWCVIDRLEGDALVRVATVHSDPETAGRGAELARAHPVRLGDRSPLARVVERGEPVFIERLQQEVIDRVATGEAHRALLEKIVSIISVPLRSPDGIVGVMSFTTAESGRVYGADDLRFGLELARRVGGAVSNANAFARERSGRKRLAALQRVTSELTRARTAEDVARAAIDAGSETLGAEVASVYVVKDRLCLLVHRGLSSEAQNAQREIALDEDRAVSVCARTGEPIWVEELAEAEARFPGHTRRLEASVGTIASYVCLPLRADDRVAAVLIYAFRHAHRFDAEERVFLTTLSENCAQSLERARLLDSARAEAARAEDASRVKDEFLAILGHELRNPLAPIFTAVELMKLRSPAASEPERKVIERQAKHLARLVDDLLDVSRIAAGRVRIERSAVDVREMVARGIELARPLIEDHRHALFTEVPDDLRVSGDLTRLAQVMANLLSNAAKYTPPGGHLSVIAAREEHAVAVRVKDDGIGISPSLLPRVFDLFTQGKQSIDRAGGGLGLGLAIVRSLVELHGGSVQARSDGEGRGSEFVVRLPPASELPRTAPPAPRLPEQKEPHRARVLVVDDNQDAATLLAEALSGGGFAIRVAHDGPSAIAAAQEFSPKVALLDLGLPVMDGFELGRRLRALPGLERLKLVAITGYGQPSDRERTARSGFDDHLVKPVELDEVLRAIGEASD